MEHFDKDMIIREPEKGMVWMDGSALTIEGKGWQETEHVYHRLPARAKKTVPDIIWNIGKCPAGMAIRFVTGSPSLAVRWDGFHAMDHMPATGVSGLDLYVRHENKWKWLAVARPSGENNEAELFSGLSRAPREFMLYLPLYRHVRQIHLGIPEGEELHPAAVRRAAPIVFYGTSITQGGCASRPGMNYTAILGRWLDRPVINLGFSGNGKMQPEVMDLLAELSPAVYVINCMPNMIEHEINEREEDGLRKLCTAHPKTPILVVDNIQYCDAYLKTPRMQRVTSSNRAQQAIIEKLRAEGMTSIRHVPNTDLIGTDGEATVDGTHFTDLGYMRFAQALFPMLNEAIESVSAADCNQPEKETVAVLGASPKPERYANIVIRELIDAGHHVFPINPGYEDILGIPCRKSLDEIPEPLDTITIYLGARRSTPLITEILNAHPARIIINPGAENPELEKQAASQGIQVQRACSIVMLKTGQF